MWKVKRMNTARIVVLTTADGAGGMAAYLANRSDNKPLPAEPIEQLPATTHGAGVMATLLATGIHAPSLTRTLK
jgi:hypothetical protein